ncbi:hypothetical protein AVEN_104075-1 [Araneus ventricosus]|uniref:Uncharacterized protein n=1 Tax=Araneus ventricosus TaxID=182803 RepID=A0A4Y2WBP2_ARAVE|nr:hypothetical protein AVEN_104075-1 [Araneus ventricosus]
MGATSYPANCAWHCTDSHFAERRRVYFVGLLAIAASTCVDVPSSVAVFGLPDLLATATEPVLMNFMISFAMMSPIICALCVAMKDRRTH